MGSISHTRTEFKNVRINVHHLVEIMHALITELTPSDDISKTIKQTNQKCLQNNRPKTGNFHFGEV